MEKRNLSITTIRNLKIFKNAVVFLTPYVILTGIAIQTAKPNEKIVSSEVNTYDNTGFESHSIIYDNGSLARANNAELIIEYPWVENEDQLFEKEIKKYEIKSVDQKEILEFMDNATLESELEELFGTPTIEKLTQNTIPEQDDDVLVSVKIYSANNDDVIFTEKTMPNRIINTMATLFVMVGVGAVQGFNYKNNYGSIRKIQKSVKEAKDKRKKLTKNYK